MKGLKNLFLFILSFWKDDCQFTNGKLTTNVSIPTVTLFNSTLPSYQTDGSSGFDLCAVTEKSFKIPPKEWTLVNTGLRMAIPKGYELQVRPRSGLALNKGIMVLNSPGTVDSDYRNDIGVIIYNNSTEPFEIKQGDRIAQGVVAKVEHATFIKLNNIEDLSKTKRGLGGFGHTGV